MLGDDVSIIPKVQNLGEDCYLRVKVEYINAETNYEDYIINMSSDFQLYEEYYYYKNVVQSGDVIKIFDGVKIPEDIRQKKIKLTITAQAIQAKNFEPDYTLSDPWKNIQPTESSNTSYDLDSKNNSITVLFEDGVEKYVTIKNDFFKNIPNIVPGDVYEDIIEINNKLGDNAKYYLDYKHLEKEYELLKKLDLVITNKDGIIVYSGKIDDINHVLLGTYKNNDNDKLVLKLLVPTDLKNAFELIIPKFELIISADYNEKKIIENNTERGGIISENIENIIENGGIFVVNPFTGDSINLSIIIFLISALGLICIMILTYKKNKNNNK